ncbi:hypothetical protein [Myxosarcina sp. GI1(2024)]
MLVDNRQTGLPNGYRAVDRSFVSEKDVSGSHWVSAVRYAFCSKKLELKMRSQLALSSIAIDFQPL